MVTEWKKQLPTAPYRHAFNNEKIAQPKHVQTIIFSDTYGSFLITDEYNNTFKME